MTNRKFALLILIIPVLLALVTASCNSTRAQLPEGIYTNTSAEGEPSITFSGGKYTDMMTSGGNRITVEEGTYVVKGDHILFTTVKGSDILRIACGSTNQSYTYQWLFDQKLKSLTLVNIDDPCEIRLNYGASNTWSYQPLP